MKGEIEYNLWTVLGTKTLKVRYDIKDEDDLTNVSLKILGDGRQPEELKDEEVMQEIVQACIQDMKTKEATEPDDYKRVLPNSLWGAN